MRDTGFGWIGKPCWGWFFCLFRGFFMSDEMTITVFCADCNESLPSEWAHQATPENICSRCGSVRKTIYINIAEDAGLEIHGNLRARTNNTTMPAKKNPRVDIFAGDDLRKSDNRWMAKERVINKDKNLYREIIKDPITGEIIHHNEEPLSQHSSHGTAKFKTKP